MTSNSQEIIQDIRTEYDMLIEFVTGEQALTATADHIERGLFKLLLKLGAKLLTLFFVMRSQAYSCEPLEMEEGQTLPYLEDKKRLLTTQTDELEAKLSKIDTQPMNDTMIERINEALEIKLTVL